MEYFTRTSKLQDEKYEGGRTTLENVETIKDVGVTINMI